MGLAAVGGMLAGVIYTICSFAVAAIVTRQRLLAVLARSEGLRLTLGWWMELFGALGVPGTRSRHAHEHLDDAPEEDVSLPRAAKTEPQ